MTPTEFRLHDPNADYGKLWVAVHDYLVCQSADQPNATDLSMAYTRLVEAHNMIHDRYIRNNIATPAGA